MFRRVSATSLAQRCAAVTVFVIVSAAPATALAAPPSISQYVEQIPTAKGSHTVGAGTATRVAATTDSATPTPKTPAQTTATPTTRTGTAPAPRKQTQHARATPGPSAAAAFSQSDGIHGIGRGILIALVLGAATITALGFAALRRR